MVGGEKKVRNVEGAMLGVGEKTEGESVDLETQSGFSISETDEGR